jgi:hypothetical protein
MENAQSYLRIIFLYITVHYTIQYIVFWHIWQFLETFRI